MLEGTEHGNMDTLKNKKIQNYSNWSKSNVQRFTLNLHCFKIIIKFYLLRYKLGFSKLVITVIFIA